MAGMLTLAWAVGQSRLVLRRKRRVHPEAQSSRESMTSSPASGRDASSGDEAGRRSAGVGVGVAADGRRPIPVRRGDEDELCGCLGVLLRLTGNSRGGEKITAAAAAAAAGRDPRMARRGEGGASASQNPPRFTTETAACRQVESPRPTGTAVSHAVSHGPSRASRGATAGTALSHASPSRRGATAGTAVSPLPSSRGASATGSTVSVGAISVKSRGSHHESTAPGSAGTNRRHQSSKSKSTSGGSRREKRSEG